MYILEGSISLLSVTVTVILITSVQNEILTAQAQKEELTFNTSAVAVIANESEPYLPSSSAAANAIARDFVQQMKEMAQHRKESNAARQQQTRQIFFESFDVGGDIGLVGTGTKDKGRRDRNSEMKLDNTQPSSQGQSTKVKVTDYFLDLPASSSLTSPRKGKHNVHFSDGNGVDSGSGSKIDADNKLVALVKSVATPPKMIVNQPLHSRNRPAVNFEVISSDIMFVFQVEEEERQKYLLSVVVEKMDCHINTVNETATPKLYIRGDEHELSLCKMFDNSLTNFLVVDDYLSGDKFISVRGVGDWTNTSASLVVSIYTEAAHCRYCPEDHFCCGKKDTACKHSVMMTAGKNKDKDLSSSSSSGEHPRPVQHARCIPREDANGASMICNGHPNCGFHCNLDELTANCPNDDDDNCSGYYCREYQQDRFVITLILLILFCVFVPFCIFLFLCSRKELRREFGRRGRCPLPLEIIFCPFSINPDDENPATDSGASGPRQSRNGSQSRTRGYARRAFRRAEEVNSGRETAPGVENPGYFDDLPPPYSACCDDKVMFPNPPKVTSSTSRNASVSRNNSNSRNNDQVPTVASSASAFQLRPIISAAPPHMMMGVSSSSRNQSVMTSLAPTPSQADGDARDVTASTTNETSH